MEKVIYLVWRDPKVDIETFARRLRGDLAAQLRVIHSVRGLRVNVADAAVAAGSGIKQTWLNPPLEAVVQVWVDSAIARLRQPVDEAVAAHSVRHAAYLVTESQPLRNLEHPPRPGERTEGFSQIALLRIPKKLDYAQWLDIWHNSHTQVAVETQSNFEYIQNVVIRPLTADAPPLDAMVEECFPIAALTDPLTFFDAPGDQAKFDANLKTMMDSVHRFIELGTIDVVPTSQYCLI
ncbi:MAG: EthD domain-containing protein [Stenotrophobium sp.]